MSVIRNYKQLDVWQQAIKMVVLVYGITDQLPLDEKYGLTSQMRRCAVSIPSNIAEGKMRGTDPEFKRFLLIAFGSGGELETQIEIVKQLSFGKNINFKELEIKLDEIMKMLNGLIVRLDTSR